MKLNEISTAELLRLLTATERTAGHNSDGARILRAEVIQRCDQPPRRATTRDTAPHAIPRRNVRRDSAPVVWRPA